MHLSPGGLGELYRRDADAACRRMDQHPLAGAQRPVAVQGRPCSSVVDRDGRSLLEGERVGKWHRIDRLHIDDLRVATEPGACEDPLAHPRRIDSIADGLDDPSHLVADDGGRLRRVRIRPNAGEVVGEVHSRSAHHDACLPWAGR